MPPVEDIQRQLLGAWRLMVGKAEGVKLLDLSADGFWNSFFAIAVALPALVAGWVGIASELADAGAGGRLSLLARLALVDLGAWLLPLVALAAAARPAGLADRFVAYVVASNWASAIIIWMMLPPTLLRMVLPAAGEAASLFSLALFVISLILSWRMTNAVIGRGPGVATGVFAGMFFASLIVLFTLQALFGLNVPDQVPAG